MPRMASECEAEPVQGGAHRISWARLLKRVFDIDMQHWRTAAAGSSRSSRRSSGGRSSRRACNDRCS